MTQSRTKALAKLSLLLGIPLLLILLLFCSGVFLGVRYQAAILRFERDWLKMAVEVPASASKPQIKQETSSPASAVKTETPAALPIVPVAPPAKPSTQISNEDKVQPIVQAELQQEPAKQVDAPVQNQIKPVPLTIALPEPLPAELNALRTAKITLKVKALVDPKIVAKNPDWLADVQQTLVWTSQIFEAQVGISLEIYGIVQWTELTNEMSNQELVTKIHAQSMDGADLVIALHSHARENIPPVLFDQENKLFSSAVVFAEPQSQAPYLRSLLYELSILLGAAPITDQNSTEFQSGSWMSSVQLSDRQPLWLDATNRQRILEYKKTLINHQGEGR